MGQTASFPSTLDTAPETLTLFGDISEHQDSGETPESFVKIQHETEEFPAVIWQSRIDVLRDEIEELKAKNSDLEKKFDERQFAVVCGLEAKHMLQRAVEVREETIAELKLMLDVKENVIQEGAKKFRNLRILSDQNQMIFQTENTQNRKNLLETQAELKRKSEENEELKAELERLRKELAGNGDNKENRVEISKSCDN